MGRWQRFQDWQVDWQDGICLAPGCAAHVAVLFDAGHRDGGFPLCLDCADLWLDRLIAHQLAPHLALPPAYA
jgi:hypothetical protein